MQDSCNYCISCKAAAEVGHIECLQYLHDIKSYWGKSSCNGAAENGHLVCLQYLIDNGCEWDDEAYSIAERNGHLECMIYLHEKELPCSKSFSWMTTLSGDLVEDDWSSYLYAADA